MGNTMMNVPEMFGSMVFNDAAMKAKLPKDVYLKLKDTIDQGAALDPTGGRCGGQCYDGLGHGKGRHPLYPLVPADDRRHRGKARQLYHTGCRRQSDDGFFR